MFRVVRGLAVAVAVGIPLIGVARFPMITPARASAGSRISIETLAVSFLDRSLGWMVAQRSNTDTGARGPLLVSRSADGGLHWHVLSSVRGPDAPQILFGDGRNGWIYGSSLYATHDGGRTWRRIPLDGSRTTLSRAGRSVWRLDTACPASGGRCRFTVLSTVAGAAAWHPLSRPPVLPGVGSSIARAGPAAAWITGTASPRMADRGLVLAATTDGGRRWHRLPMPCNHTGFGALSMDVVSHTTSDLWLVCASQPSAGGQAKAVFRSSSGGRSWRLLSRSSVFGYGGRDVGTLPGVGYLDNLAVPSSRDAWLSLDRDTLYHTADGGRTWHPAIPITVANPRDGGIGPVQFVDRRHGWLLSFPRLLFRTTDGGRSWQEIS